jgi:hypothetical protein
VWRNPEVAARRGEPEIFTKPHVQPILIGHAYLRSLGGGVRNATGNVAAFIVLTSPSAPGRPAIEARRLRARLHRLPTCAVADVSGWSKPTGAREKESGAPSMPRMQTHEIIPRISASKELQRPILLSARSASTDESRVMRDGPEAAAS